MLLHCRPFTVVFIVAMALSGTFAANKPDSLPPGRIFVPSAAAGPNAPDGTATTRKPYSLTIPATLLDERGSISMWFKSDKTLRGKGPKLTLLNSEAITAKISRGRFSTELHTSFGSAMAESRPHDAKRIYRIRTQFTHLKAGRWYHVAWTWDAADASRNGCFLNGVKQGIAPPYGYDGQIKAADADVAIQVGSKDLTVSAVRLYEMPLAERDFTAFCKGFGVDGYVDEGIRFTGEKFIPTDVDWAHPVYKTSFDDTSVLEDWQLEGGWRIGVADGNLILESKTKSVRPEAGVDHLVCWLKREVPADFLLEFTMRPQKRSRGLNIVFFNARGLNGENIFEPPIKPRNGLFKQYHSGDINNYHVSYWSGDRGTSNLRKNKGFALAAIGKDLVYTAPDDVFQTIRLYKRGGTIRLMVDDVVALMYDDDGKTFGPIHTHSGWIALRQMGHTHRCEYGHIKVYPLKATPGK